MYLSRLVLNPRSRPVQRDLADCHQLHRTLMRCFPAEAPNGEARAALGVLYRVERAPHTGEVTTLVQSAVWPDWSQLAEGYLLPAAGPRPNPDTKAVGPVYDAISAGAVLRFRLAANPTRKVMTKTGPDGQRRNGKRDRLLSEEDQLVWLARQSQRHGFRVLTARAHADLPNVSVTAIDRVTGWRGSAEGSGRQPLNLARVQFDGLLRVEDAAAFRAALAAGIGPGKAYGFGLLSIAPARQP